MSKAISKTANGEDRMVVVVTEGNAIFCGWTDNADGNAIKLRAARQAVYYSADTHGLLGLAANGPGQQSRIGPPADMIVRKVTHVIECSPEAVRVWEGAKWTD